MLRDWSDEWKNARLALHLRGDELFQGETLRILIHATVALDTTPSGGSLDAAGLPQSDGSASGEEARAVALEKLEARWRQHCDGALVDLKVVEPAPSKQDKFVQQLQQQHASAAHPPLAPLPQQPRTTLFHQESRLALLPLRPEDVTPTTKASSLRVTLALRCECTLRIRAEFWQRPLTLIARVTPDVSREEGDADGATAVQPLTSMLLNETFTRTQIFGRLREQTTEPPNLMRRIEHRLRVVKPVVLKMETKFASGNRVVIVARATNTHDTLGVHVLDLQLHINQFAASGSSGSRGAIKGDDYRVAQAPTDNFPVDLQPHEQFNFVFILEPAGSGPNGSALPTSRSSNPNSLDSQQSLLTLSWETLAKSERPAQEASLLQPITEHHTILWSPHPHRFAASAHNESMNELVQVLPQPPPLVPNIAAASLAFSVVRRGDRACPLSVTLAPLQGSSSSPDSASHRVGVVETLCVIVTNRSQDGTEFDLSLVVPALQPAHRSWLAFEASHHLGRLRPGTIIRKSVRLVFLRHGRANLNALLLFDHLSCTWFLPPLPSASSAWEVFVHP